MEACLSAVMPGGGGSGVQRGVGVRAPGSASSPEGRAKPAASAPTEGSQDPYKVLDYRYGDDPAQFVNLYLPGGPGPYPVLLYLHSGGWVAGANEFIPDFLWAQIARAKVALVSVDYRLSGFAADGSSVNAFPVPNEDVDEAIRYVREHAATWNLDPKMFVVSGASAGGHLALMAGADPGQFVSPSLPRELRRVSPKVEGVMDFVGPSDLVWLIHNAIGFAKDGVIAYLGCPEMQLDTCSESLAKQASPQTYLRRGGAARILRVRGSGHDDSRRHPGSRDCTTMGRGAR